MTFAFKAQEVSHELLSLVTHTHSLCLDGGLEELNDEFSDGKVQFAYAKVIDPNTELPKYVFIGWVKYIHTRCQENVKLTFLT